MGKRLVSIDYLRGVYIVLMVIFHLVYIGDKYPYLKEVVYTFHMSGFLVISGYLANVEKDWKAFARSMVWILVPYAIMEAGYVVMSSVLPVREHVDRLSVVVLCDKMLCHPMGPYWYLHTLILCSVAYYLTVRVSFRLNAVSLVCLLGLVFWGLAEGLHLMSFYNGMYFLLGVWVRRSRCDFQSVFLPSLWAWIPFLLLCAFPSNLGRHTLTGVVITVLSMSALLGIYTYIPTQVRSVCHFIGRNTLPILLFSPIFTIITRFAVPFFAFDPTGVCFTVASVAFVLAGCFAIAWTMDRWHLSRYFCGKKMLC